MAGRTTTALPMPVSMDVSERVKLQLAFFAIYVIWGSTYLAIRFAVEVLPPLFTAGTRHLIAGSVLLLWATLAGRRATAAEWRASLITGALFFLLGHGALHWAERTVPSGVASLLYATEPIWIAGLLGLMTTKASSRGTEIGDPTRSMAPDRRSRLCITWSMASGLILGLVGVGLLVSPDLTATSGTSLTGTLAVLASAAAWSLGVVYSRRVSLPEDPTLRAGTTLLSGAVLLVIVGTLAGEPSQLQAATLTWKAVGSLAYLVVFGSLIAYTAYMWLLERCSPTLVATHTYVNPLVAVFLGWLIGDETLSLRVLGATALILLAVLLVGAETPDKPA